MNATDRAALNALPVPYSEGEPAQAGVRYDERRKAWSLYWLVSLSKLDTGKFYPDVRSAIAAAEWLNERVGL